MGALTILGEKQQLVIDRLRGFDAIVESADAMVTRGRVHWFHSVITERDLVTKFTCSIYYHYVLVRRIPSLYTVQYDLQ